ncbi:hypothetical protein BJY00DRAFT_179169 [Aspergillus carlsbadensis]|nr:hypothetical protein BJY00DRAFT_179169 [Aspergillus carlsbadensis]
MTLMSLLLFGRHVTVWRPTSISIYANLIIIYYFTCLLANGKERTSIFREVG